MKASEYKAWITETLEKVIEQYGDIPVVAWHPSDRLDEKVAHRHEVQIAEYRSTGSVQFKNRCQMVMVLGE